MIRVHQIFYSAQTRRLLDPGFVPLDNLGNERPDWREYWPIRRHLQAQMPEDGHFVGFLSPKFKTKSGLDAAEVHQFVEAHHAAADVMLFSPFYDQCSYYRNPFEQALSHHSGIHATFKQSMALIAPGLDIDTSLISSRHTVYCNFFVANGRFWRRWFAAGERIFALAEQADSDLGRALNADVAYNSGAVPFKVFVIERIASALLAAEPGWRVQTYNPLLLPLANRRCVGLSTEMSVLDALKLAYEVQGFPHYREAYLLLRTQYLRAMQ